MEEMATPHVLLAVFCGTLYFITRIIKNFQVSFIHEARIHEESLFLWRPGGSVWWQKLDSRGSRFPWFHGPLSR